MKKYGIELFGTFFLVLTVAMSGNILAIAGVLAAVIYVGGPISGGHFNPAVSLAMWMQKKLANKELAAYVGAQMLGGILAAAVSFLLLSHKFIPSPGDGINWWTALLAEAIFTFLLVFTVLQVALPKKAAGNQYYGAAIALTVLAGGICVGAVSGGVFNPAVGIGPLLFDIAAISSHWSSIGLYLLGPLAGGVLASLAFNYTNPDNSPKI